MFADTISRDTPVSLEAACIVGASAVGVALMLGKIIASQKLMIKQQDESVQDRSSIHSAMARIEADLVVIKNSCPACHADNADKLAEKVAERLATAAAKKLEHHHK